MLCTLGEIAGNKFEKQLDVHLLKLTKIVEYCEYNELSVDETVEYIYKSGLWLNTKEKLKEILYK